MPGAVANRITVEDFDKLDLPEDREWELQNGEVVGVSLPAVVHRRLQDRLSVLLKPIFPGAEVLIEYSFQVGDYDKRSADLGVTSMERAGEIVGKGILLGAPEVVIEVLSPSNSYSQMKHYRLFCQQHGTVLFLVVDPDDNTIEAWVGEKRTVYRLGDVVPIETLGVSAQLPVAKVFEGITTARSEK